MGSLRPIGEAPDEHRSEHDYALFWAAFILTRPLGAVVGDFLDKPTQAGGLALSRFVASAALLIFIVACIVLFPQRAAKQAH